MRASEVDALQAFIYQLVIGRVELLCQFRQQKDWVGGAQACEASLLISLAFLFCCRWIFFEDSTEDLLCLITVWQVIHRHDALFVDDSQPFEIRRNIIVRWNEPHNPTT